MFTYTVKQKKQKNTRQQWKPSALKKSMSPNLCMHKTWFFLFVWYHGPNSSTCPPACIYSCTYSRAETQYKIFNAHTSILVSTFKWGFTIPMYARWTGCSPMIDPQKRMSHQSSGLAVAALATKKGGREEVSRMEKLQINPVFIILRNDKREKHVKCLHSSCSSQNKWGWQP